MVGFEDGFVEGVRGVLGVFWGCLGGGSSMYEGLMAKFGWGSEYVKI